MDNDKRTITNAVIGILVIIFALIVIYGFNIYKIAFNTGIVSVVIPLVKSNFTVFRVAFAIGGFCASALIPKMKIRKNMTDNIRLLVIVLAVSTFFIISMGYFGIKIYDAFIYPLILLCHLPLCYFAVVALKDRKSFTDQNIFGISNKESDFKFVLPTQNGKDLVIHSPQQSTMFDGGNGSGKSDQLKKIIVQAVENENPCFIYDYEGDPTAGGESPQLTRIAYKALLDAKKNNPNNKLTFAFINYVDLFRTNRVNPLSERYMTDNTKTELYITNLATIIMKNLEPSWKEKTDFWANNAISFVSAISHALYNLKEKDCNTLAHVVAMSLQPAELVFRWLDDSKERIQMNMSPLLNAWKLKADQQTAGVISTSQLPLTKLNQPNIYWVLSPNKDEELSLDVSNKENPLVLCIGNCPEIKDSISPAISPILSCVMNQMNKPGKRKSLFLIDELPSILIYRLDDFMSTVRKHFVATMIAFQDFKQVVRDYGQNAAEIIRSNCGNQLYGMTGNVQTAEIVEKMFGEIEVTKTSYSENENGGGSSTESQQREKALKIRDVMGQPVGHFVGKISNGTPPFFNEQLTRFDGVGEDIPRFANIDINTGNLNTDKAILEKLVERNYDKINSMVKTILEPYKDKDESPEEAEDNIVFFKVNE